MQKLSLKLVILFCLLPVTAKAMLFSTSNTAVTATVKDSDGHAWANGTWTAELVIPGGKSGKTVTVGGVPVVSPRKGVLNENGVMNATLTDTRGIDQPGAEWKITICPNTNLAPNGAVECTTYITATTGDSLDLSSKFASTATPLLTAAKAVAVSHSVASVSAGTPGGNICNLQYNADGTNFGGDTGTCTDGVGNVKVKTLSGIPYFNLYGTSAPTRGTAYSTDCALIATTQGCALMVAPADILSQAPRWIFERPYSGGSGGSNYFGVQANAKPLSIITQYQGMLNFRVQNPAETQGSGVVFNIDRSHRVAQSVSDFQIVSLNTYGQQHGSNRDNMGVLALAGTSKGAQLGGILSINGNCFGQGDCVGITYQIESNGLTDGDQEGGAITRGYNRASVRRFVTTTTAAPTLDAGSQLYSVPNNTGGAPNGADPLGLWQTILNLSSFYNAGGIQSFQQNTTYGGVKWITATGDSSAGLLSHYGASIIQPITALPSGVTSIKAVNPSETLGTRVATTVTVASTAGFPSTGVGSVVDQLTYEPGVPFTVVDSTHITINTYGDHGINTLIVYGGATGLALSMDADVIAAGNSQYGNAAAMRPHTLPVIGTTEAGDLVLWNIGKTGQNGLNTRALLTTTYPVLTVTPTISGGAITSATITESGNEYRPISRVLANSGSVFYADTGERAPTPTVSFSAGCDATATVGYYIDAISGLLMLGTPSTTAALGGTKTIQITNAGTTCAGATVSIQNVYPSNSYHLYDFGVVPTWAYVSDGAGGKLLSSSPLYMALQYPDHWWNSATNTGVNISSEVWPHIRVDESTQVNIQNYEDGGSNITWSPHTYDGLRSGDNAVSYIMSDTYSSNGTPGPRAAEFAQRGLPVIQGVQGYRSPAGTAMALIGQFGNLLNLSSPNSLGSLINVTAQGYASPAYLSKYRVLSLTSIDGASNASLYFDPVARALQLASGVPFQDFNGNDLQPRYLNTIASGGTYVPTSTQSELACPGVNFTIPYISTNTGMKVDVYNTNASTSCVITLSQNVGNVGAWQSSTYTLAPNQHVMFQGTGNSRWFFANDQAATAASLAGGGAYFQPYQSAANATAFAAPGSDGQVWTTHSTTGAPGWSTLPTGSSSTLGLVKADGTTITATGGVLTAVASVGYNDVTSSRAYATNYTNSTGHRIKVRWTGVDVDGAHAVQLACYVNGTDIAWTEVGSTNANGKFTVECDVPNGSTYQVTTASSGGFTAATIAKVLEETF